MLSEGHLSAVTSRWKCSYGGRKRQAQEETRWVNVIFPGLPGGEKQVEFPDSSIFQKTFLAVMTRDGPQKVFKPDCHTYTSIGDAMHHIQKVLTMPHQQFYLTFGDEVVSPKDDFTWLFGKTVELVVYNHNDPSERDKVPISILDVWNNVPRRWVPTAGYY